MMKKLLLILLALGGEALLVFLFFFLIPPSVLSDNLRILDFIVVSVIYLVWIYNIARPAVRLDSESQKDIGGLGIRWSFTFWYSILALAVVIIPLAYTWSEGVEPLGFKAQLAIQCALLLILLIGFVSAEHGKDQVDKVYKEEKILKKEKTDIRNSLRELVFVAEDNPSTPEEVKKRLKRLSDDSRYLSPSVSADASMLDSRLLECYEQLKGALYDPEINKERINALLGQLERDYERRRKL